MAHHGRGERFRPAAGGEGPAQGDRVIGTSRSAEALSDPRSRYARQLRIIAIDLRDPSSVRAAVDRAFAASARIDVVVSKAGYGLLGAAEEASDMQVRDIVETNLLGSITLIQSVLPYLRRQGGGRVLQVSSADRRLRRDPADDVRHSVGGSWVIKGDPDRMTDRQKNVAIAAEFTDEELARL